jgi:hypothetical protein
MKISGCHPREGGDPCVKNNYCAFVCWPCFVHVDPRLRGDDATHGDA